MFILLMLMEVCGVVWEQKKEIIMGQQNLSDKKQFFEGATQYEYRSNFSLVHFVVWLFQ